MAVGWTSLAMSVVLQVGQPAPSETPNYPALPNANAHYGHEGQYEQRYPFDTQQNWVHGYFQEIPAYGGHVFFRPYNYKDILSQSQTAAGWGAAPQLPYSQQFWHRYHDQATMLKMSQTSQPAPNAYYPAAPAMTGQPVPGAMWSQTAAQPYAQPYSPAPQPYATAPQYSSQQYSAQQYPVQQYTGPQFPAQQYAAPQYAAPQYQFPQGAAATNSTMVPPGYQFAPANSAPAMTGPYAPAPAAQQYVPVVPAGGQQPQFPGSGGPVLSPQY